jgi:hypothetical protein
MESDDDAVGKEVCQQQGDVTHEGTDDEVGAFSNEFDEGTVLKVTNTENDKSVEVPIIGNAGSCVLLTLSALKEIQNNENNLVIRQNRVELVKGGENEDQPEQDQDQPEQDQDQPDKDQPDADEQEGDDAEGEIVCEGEQITHSGDGKEVGFTSDEFGEGSILKITNLKNGKSATGPVVGGSGSCLLLTLPALREIQENPNNEVIRENRVELIKLVPEEEPQQQ